MYIPTNCIALRVIVWDGKPGQSSIYDIKECSPEYTNKNQLNKKLSDFLWFAMKEVEQDRSRTIMVQPIFEDTKKDLF